MGQWIARSESGHREHSQEKDKGRNVELEHGRLPVIMPQYAWDSVQLARGKDELILE